MTPTPRTDANESITCKEGDPCIAPDFARQLETELTATRKYLADANRGAQVNAHINQSLAGQLNVARSEIAELNERLIDRQQTLMEWIIENRNLKRELAKGNLAQILALRTAIEETLEANSGLADGDDCTLKALKDAVGWE